jgi:hypothetical protein
MKNTGKILTTRLTRDFHKILSFLFDRDSNLTLNRQAMVFGNLSVQSLDRVTVGSSVLHISCQSVKSCGLAPQS